MTTPCKVGKARDTRSFLFFFEAATPSAMCYFLQGPEKKPLFF